MSNDKYPSFPTAIRFQQDLQINGLTERSQESYGRAIRKFSEFIKREPFALKGPNKQTTVGIRILVRPLQGNVWVFCGYLGRRFATFRRCALPKAILLLPHSGRIAIAYATQSSLGTMQYLTTMR